jgi:hypothetical protein
LEYLDWEPIIFGQVVPSVIEQELLNYIIKLASCAYITLILTENGKPSWVLKYEIDSGKFYKDQIGKI